MAKDDKPGQDKKAEPEPVLTSRRRAGLSGPRQVRLNDDELILSNVLRKFFMEPDGNQYVALGENFLTLDARVYLGEPEIEVLNRLIDEAKAIHG